MMMFASHLGYKVGVFGHLVQNLHVYDRHLDAVNEVLKRPSLFVQPTMKLKENKNFYDFTVEDFVIEGVEGIKPLNSSLEIAI